MAITVYEYNQLKKLGIQNGNPSNHKPKMEAIIGPPGTEPPNGRVRETEKAPVAATFVSEVGARGRVEHRGG